MGIFSHLASTAAITYDPDTNEKSQPIGGYKLHTQRLNVNRWRVQERGARDDISFIRNY